MRDQCKSWRMFIELTNSPRRQQLALERFAHDTTQPIEGEILGDMSLPIRHVIHLWSDSRGGRSRRRRLGHRTAAWETSGSRDPWPRQLRQAAGARGIDSRTAGRTPWNDSPVAHSIVIFSRNFDNLYSQYNGSTRQYKKKLDGKYSERVQLPAKATFWVLSQTRQHLPHLLL